MRITSSSISSSERALADWRGFTVAFAAATSLVFALLFAFVVAVDPYDTGRFALLRATGVPAQIPRTSHASRGRDPAIDAAILGNSHVQILAPAELQRLTGTPFVSLAVPGIGPKETMLLGDYFLRHRTRPARAFLIGIDPFWCRDDPAISNWMPFPFWLYDPSPWRYLAGLVRDQSLDDAFKRLGWALGWSKRVRARPDGLWDYDEGFTWQDERHGAYFAGRGPSGILNESGRFPAMDALGRWLDTLPANLAVVLLRPPVHTSALSEPGSPLARSEEACRAALETAADGRPAVVVVDRRVDRPAYRVPQNFIDRTHYRSGIAREVEADVAAALVEVETRLRSVGGRGGG